MTIIIMTQSLLILELTALIPCGSAGLRFLASCCITPCTSACFSISISTLSCLLMSSSSISQVQQQDIVGMCKQVPFHMSAIFLSTYLLEGICCSHKVSDVLTVALNVFQCHHKVEVCQRLLHQGTLCVRGEGAHTCNTVCTCIQPWAPDTSYT